MTGEASTFPTVTPELLDDVVQRILDVGSPRRIVLFGRSPLSRFSFRCSAGLQACRHGGPEGPHYSESENALGLRLPQG